MSERFRPMSAGFQSNLTGWLPDWSGCPAKYQTSVRSPDNLRVINLRIATELDAKIREIPYGTGSRFTPDKGCLTGTRTAFLDFIAGWVNDLASERCLVLFGQAGTGKSSIAHAVARRFDTIHR